MSKVPDFAPRFQVNGSSTLKVSHNEWVRYNIAVSPPEDCGFSFEVKINQIESTGNWWACEIGVVYKSKNECYERGCIGGSIGCCYISNNGNFEACCGSGHDYGQPYNNPGDVVRMTVYADKRVEYFLNDESQGICFTLFESPVIPAICVSSIVDLELLSYSEFDDDVVPDESSEDKRDTIPQVEDPNYIFE
eukprot:TRINITY_DN1395_c0_g1_i4.p1 TRINITY_DN1395_c0_g1~~TRINITY_DN1395_c0_g1_i4.p1  ORF type:complete len:192 (+),score=46.07 TRINITY_DN1395_c0_g1_i4:159-734(+)